MPESDTATGQQATSEGSATPSSPSDAESKDDGYDPQWVTKLTPRHKADLEEFFKTHPVHKELETVKSEVARRQKWGNLTKDQLESVADAMRSLESYKALVVNLGIATEEEVEDAQTPRELELVLKGRSAKQTPASKPGSKDGEENPFFSQLDAWAKSRGIKPAGDDAAPKKDATSGKAWGIDGLGGGRQPGSKTYKELISSGASAAEIDAANAAWLQRQG